MRILEILVENFKKVRLVEIVPKRRIVQITGRNGQGKTSVLDALWAMFEGKKAIPEKPVRRGADKAKLKVVIGDDAGKPLLIARRTIHQNRTTQVTVEAAPGAERPAGTPQAVLDELTGAMTFDPLAFISMPPKQQVEILRSTVKLDVDIEALNEANRADYEKRTELNRRIEQANAAIEATTRLLTLPEVPQHRLDEAAILALLDDANNKNQAAQQQEHIRAEANTNARAAESAVAVAQQKLSQLDADMKDLEHRLAKLRKTREEIATTVLQLGKVAGETREHADSLPRGELVDVSALARDLETARRINEEISRRELRAKQEKEREALQREAMTLTRQMEQREERKREAFAGAKLPVEGITLNEEGVLWNGLPLENAGEAEQIRIGVGLAMASRPKLRMIPIRHGEALDDHSLALIEKLAEENDFVVFMTRVDSSGKVGVVIVDGEVASDNQ